MTLERTLRHVEDAETSANQVDQRWAAKHRAALERVVDWLEFEEKVEKLVKHAAPIHPGTGTDQSVHGGGGGFSPRFVRIRTHEGSSVRGVTHLGPEDLPPIPDDPEQALDMLDETGSYLMGLRQRYGEMIRKEAIADIEERIDAQHPEWDAKRRAKELKSVLDGARARRLYNRAKEKIDAKIEPGLEAEILAAQNRMRQIADNALPEVMQRGNRLRSLVLSRIEGGDSEINRVDHAFIKDNRDRIMAENPELAKIWEKHESALESAVETRGIYGELVHLGRTRDPDTGEPLQNKLPARFVDAGGERRTVYYAVPKDDIKLGGRYDNILRFKNWKHLVNDPDWASRLETRIGPSRLELNFREHQKAEIELITEWKAELGEDWDILSGQQIHSMYGEALDSGRNSIRRFYSRSDNLVDEFYREAKATLSTKKSDLVIDVFEANGISMGGQLEYTSSRATKGTKFMDSASRFIPTAWIEQSNANGPITVHGRDMRADYTHNDGLIRASGKWSNQPTLHEFGHRVEHINPVVNALEAAYYDWATGGTTETVALRDLKPNHGYRSDEFSRPDEFSDPYMGKRYSYGSITVTDTGHVGTNNAFELLSYGLPKAVYEDSNYGTALNDRDADFVYGLIDVAGR